MDQWNKFKASVGGTVTGSPTDAYDLNSYLTGLRPANAVSWYEAAQFVNWLNTSTGHQAAYKFTGTQGTSNYTFVPWASTDAGYNASNPYRNSSAMYFLPTEDEWVKAAYWNGTTLQEYATKAGDSVSQGNGTSGTGWNYDNLSRVTWNVGSGSQELNGTYDMMGNVWEWMESPFDNSTYSATYGRGARGGSIYWGSSDMGASSRRGFPPSTEYVDVGFRVASGIDTAVPEPGSVVMLVGLGLIGALGYAWRRRRGR